MQFLTCFIAFLLLCLPLHSVASDNNKASPSSPSKIKTTVATDENGNQIFYAYAGDTNQVGVIFIHGTPGSWRAFADYLDDPQLQKRFFMVSLDRPGWGNSTLPSKKINGEFALQSAAIGQIINSFPDKKWVLVGHSLGASIAPRVALDYTDQIIGMLLLAGSLKPSLGEPRWYNRLASTWLVAKLIGKSMKHSNREIMGLRNQLTIMDEVIKRRFMPINIIIIQGKKDRLVSPKNPRYALNAWQDSFANIQVDEIENEGHFIPWRQKPRVIDALYALVELNH